MNKSKLSLYSLAIVVSDLNQSGWSIECVPTEVLTTASGTLKEDEDSEISEDIEDAKGEKVSVTFKKSSTITATWISFGNYNRATAPDVCRGEVVLLLRYAGEDKFFWMPLFSQFDLRKKETVMYAYSNKDSQVESEDELRTNLYYTQFDTINKLVKLHTATNDGESSGYDIEVNTGDGMLSIADTNDNVLTWNSVDGTLQWSMTKDITITTDTNIELNFKGIKINNGKDELITVLEELVSFLDTMQHTGNMGAPTSISPASKLELSKIKQKISGFKA